MIHPDLSTTSRLIMPELVLFNTVKSVLAFVRNDFHSHSNEADTWLYKMFNGHQVGSVYNFFEQAKAVFLYQEDSPRYLDVRLFFDTERAPMPTIHINLPSENEGENGIGVDEGFGDPIYNEVEKTFTKTYTRRYDADYNLIITSENPFEVIMIYHFLKAIFVAIFDHIQLSGLENPKTKGQDLQLYSEIIPQNVFMRGFGLSFSYDMIVPDAFDNKMISDFLFEAKPIISPYKP